MDGLILILFPDPDIKLNNQFYYQYFSVNNNIIIAIIVPPNAVPSINLFVYF